jgi:hypothetical protein
MAQRDINNFREVTQVVAKNPNTLLSAGAEIGAEIMRQGQEARINENLSKAQIDLSALETKYQTDFESDPLGGMEEYKQNRQAIFDGLGEQISPLYRKYWNDATRKITLQNDATQQGWALKQTRVNTVKAVNQSMKNNFLQANIDGQKFGKSDESEIGAYINFENSKSALAAFGNKNLGETTTGEMLSDYGKDYVKSFISGVADSNPEKAAQLLASDQVKGMFKSDEIDTMENVVRKSAKRKEIGSLWDEMQNEDKATEIVSNEEGDYFSKRLEIDTMEMKGQISTTTAEKARRVLTSQKNVDNVTSTPAMAEIVNQMYDLNAVADTSSEDYLNGVQNIRNRILTDQEKGKLTPQDAQKLNGQLRTLTAQRTAQATQSVAMGFYESNQKFNSLPPEYRGEATRQLFYKSQGQDLTPEQFDAEANKIVDNINKGIRQETVKRLDKINAPDEDFLKSIGASVDDVKETAKIYGITEQEVIQRLKAQKQ